MTEHKQEQDMQTEMPSPEEETQPAAAEETAAADEAAAAAAETEEALDVEALKAQLEASEAKAAEYLDGWQRAQAEFINYKKRQQRVQEAQFLDMKAEIVRQLLPLLDDLELALQNRPQTEDQAVQQWVEGVEVIYRKFLTILEGQGVERIAAQDAPFDPNLHEAISQEPSETHESGQVIDVLRHGYRVGERVIRPALVRVAA